MSKLTQLQATSSLKEFAPLLDVTAGMLSYLLYKKPKVSLYKKFEIPKKHGGSREIMAPEKELKLIQYRLSNLLQECQREVSSTNGHLEDENHQGIAHGFKKYHSIMTNGRAHVTQRYVYNLDLHDFFGSINFGRVRGFFIKDKNYSLHPAVATVIAQIACYENKLPQGSPCSPVISNLIGHTLDILLVKLALNLGVIYTRYADDLTFSTNKKEFPAEIATESSKDTWSPSSKLSHIIQKSGFNINSLKTRMQYFDSRQEVTGLTVNRKINVPATYRNKLRAMVDHLLKTGEFEFHYKKNNVIVNQIKGGRLQLLGMLSYIDYVDRFNYKLRVKNGLEPFDTVGRVELFRRFIYYNSFYALEQPIIVCEGKTDNVYLKCAIKSLAASYPQLITSSPTLKLKIKFYKYSDKRTSAITQLSGGVGGICNFMKNYHNDVANKFKAPLPKHPVIVLIDNDNGAHSIYEAIAGITKKPKPAGKAEFIHVTGNLYVVPTPLGTGNKPTAIEDFFDAKTLALTWNGKTFNKDKDADSTLHYPKSVFSTQIVAKNMNTIDFNNFKTILSRISKVIIDYENTLKK